MCKIFICEGSLMYNELFYPFIPDEESESFNIFEWSNFKPLTEEEEEKFYNETNEVWLLQDCKFVDWDEEEGENIPCNTDVHIKFFVQNNDQLLNLKKEVRLKIKEIVK